MASDKETGRATRLRELGDELREARKAAGLKQEEVAQRIGVSPITVSRWERGVQEMNVGDFHKYMVSIGAPDFYWEFYDPDDDKSPGDQSLGAQIRRKREREATFTLNQHARLAKLEEFARRVRGLLDELGVPPEEPEPEGQGKPLAPEIVSRDASARDRRRGGQSA